MEDQTSQAIDCFRSAIAADPALPVPRMNLALATAIEDWSTGFRDFARELQAAPDDIKTNTDDPAFLFHVVLQTGSTPEGWQSRLLDLVAIYRGAGLISTLGTALVRSLVHFRPDRFTKPVLHEWLGAIDQLTLQDEAFIVPVRLYRVGVRSIHLNDPGVLLELPIEERQIVEEVLERRRTAPGNAKAKGT